MQLTTDRHSVRPEVVEPAFGADIDYAVLKKACGAFDEGQRRYSPATCIGRRTEIIQGSPDLLQASISFVGCQSLTKRMGMQCFTRLWPQARRPWALEDIVRLGTSKRFANSILDLDNPSPQNILPNKLPPI